MTLPRTLNRTLAIALLASTALLTIAPAAMAGHGPRKYKHRARYDSHAHRVVVRESSAAPLVAGLIGGFLLGQVVSNAQAAPVVVHEQRYVYEPRHRYYDPYCDDWFTSLSVCRDHSWEHRHPAIVQVYNGRGGECVRTMRWSRDAWYDVDRRDWDDDRDWRD